MTLQYRRRFIFCDWRDANDFIQQVELRTSADCDDIVIGADALTVECLCDDLNVVRGACDIHTEIIKQQKSHHHDI